MAHAPLDRRGESLRAWGDRGKVSHAAQRPCAEETHAGTIAGRRLRPGAAQRGEVSVSEKRDFFALKRGDVIGPYEARLESADARAYLDATAAGETAGSPAGWLPPLQLGALLVEKLIDAIEIPPGLLHTGQSFEFIRAVAPGTDFTAQLRVAQVSDRRGIRLGTVELELRDAEGTCAVGRANVLAPVPAPGGAPS